MGTAWEEKTLELREDEHTDKRHTDACVQTLLDPQPEILASGALHIPDRVVCVLCLAANLGDLTVLLVQLRTHVLHTHTCGADQRHLIRG